MSIQPDLSSMINRVDSPNTGVPVVAPRPRARKQVATPGDQANGSTDKNHSGSVKEPSMEAASMNDTLAKVEPASPNLAAPGQHAAPEQHVAPEQRGRSGLVPQRVDPSHSPAANTARVDSMPHSMAVKESTGKKPAGKESIGKKTAGKKTTGLEPPSSELASGDQEAWLRLHAAELIRRLQAWAHGLDIREATFNAAMARQDVRERQFRIQQSEFQAEMNSATEAADELRKQIAAQCRRLAFQTLA